jgi:hypothetical protein
MSDLIKQQQDRLKQEQEYLKQITALSEEFSDLCESSLRWAKVLCSEQVNNMAVDVEFRHSCGCCPGAAIYAMPYVDRGEHRVYANPPQMFIGESATFGYGEIPEPEWEKEVRSYNVTDAVVKKIKKYFADNPETNFSDEGDDV